MSTPEEMERTLRGARESGIAGVNVLSSAFLFALRGRIISLAAELRLPVNDARLGRLLGWRLRLCRKLKHRCLLTLVQVRQENKRAIREFECVVIHIAVRLC